MYVSDSLYAIPRGHSASIRFHDLLFKVNEEPKSGEEIVKEVMIKGGLKFNSNDGVSD